MILVGSFQLTKSVISVFKSSTPLDWEGRTVCVATALRRFLFCRNKRKLARHIPRPEQELLGPWACHRWGEQGPLKLPVVLSIQASLTQNTTAAVTGTMWHRPTQCSPHTFCSVQQVLLCQIQSWLANRPTEWLFYPCLTPSCADVLPHGNPLTSAQFNQPGYSTGHLAPRDHLLPGIRQHWPDLLTSFLSENLLC